MCRPKTCQREYILRSKLQQSILSNVDNKGTSNNSINFISNLLKCLSLGITEIGRAMIGLNEVC